MIIETDTDNIMILHIKFTCFEFTRQTEDY